MKKLNEDFTNLYKRWKGGEKRKESIFHCKEVDLGLPSGTIWCDRNIGAGAPTEYGGYYAWGETEEKDNYSWDTYKFGDKDNLTKYNETDKKTTLDKEDDVVNKIMGDNWHIPTKEQCNELIEYTISEWCIIGGVKGRLFIGKTNGNQLFIPAAGYMDDSSIDGVGCDISICSSNIAHDGHTRSVYLYSLAAFSDVSSFGRHFGFSVRGVKNKKE